MITTDSCSSVHDAPEISELEVSLFGTGFGEAVVVHMPGGRWVLVDSCRDPDGRPASLRYLAELNVDVANDVRVILASHWHADHVDGIADTVAACHAAEPVISGALHCRELFAFVHAARYLGETVPRAIQELRKLTDVIGACGPGRTLTMAQSRLQLLKYDYDGFSNQVVALSPSPASAHAALSDLAEAGLVSGDAPRFPQPDHNGAAVVLQIRSGDIGVLLGSDLEIHADSRRGWRAIANTFSGEKRHDLVKIAHHGSSNGNASCIWDLLMCSSPIGLLTHFHNGSVHLPEAAELASIGQRCELLISTSGPAYTARAISVDDLVARLGSARSPSASSRRAGHVRARITPGGGRWRIDMCGHASIVTDDSKVDTAEACATSPA